MESSLKRQITIKKRELKSLENKYKSMLKKKEEERKRIIKRKYEKNQERSNKVVNEHRRFRVNLSRKVK